MEDVYRLCTAQPKSHSERLYYELKAFLTEHVELVAKKMAAYDGDVLGEYRRRWVDYRKGIQVIHMIFRYLNSNWIKKTLEDSRNRLGGIFQSDGGQKDVHEIYTLGLLLWKELVFESLGSRVITRTLEVVHQDRIGNEVDVAVCAQTIESFVCIGLINKGKPLELYKDEFEAVYLDKTRDFYRVESLDYIDQNGISAYMNKAEERLAQEELRSKRFLDKSSLDTVRKEIASVLIEAHRVLLHSECRAYLERLTAAVSSNEKPDVGDLQRMYSLLLRIPDGVEPMLEVFNDYVMHFVKEKLAALGKKADHPEDYCEVLLSSYVLFRETVVETAFSAHAKFVQALDRAMRQVINEKNSSPELLARYCDSLLKKGKNKGSSVEDLDGKLKSLITVFRYLDDKDIFQKFYSKYLARRLIHGTSVSDDSEEGVLSNLKQACGFEYTNKLQRMFTDMTLCEEVNSKFQEFRTANLDTNKVVAAAGSVAFYIMVLTQGSWPLSVNKSSFKAPREMLACMQSFSEYYDSVHQGRKLSYLHHLGKADLRINFLKKKYQVTVTDFQCGVLTLWNERSDDKRAIDWAELSAVTAMSDSELGKTMASLVASKLILRTSDGENDAAGALYDINTKYQNKHLKFKITSAVQAETEKDKKKTYKAVDEDRTIFLQALIVRIMKARKRLGHNQLLTEVIAQASGKFHPAVSLIKKQCEALLEKEFLKRSEEDSGVFEYIA